MVLYHTGDPGRAIVQQHRERNINERCLGLYRPDEYLTKNYHNSRNRDEKLPLYDFVPKTTTFFLIRGKKLPSREIARLARTKIAKMPVRCNGRRKKPYFLNPIAQDPSLSSSSHDRLPDMSSSSHDRLPDMVTLVNSLKSSTLPHEKQHEKMCCAKT